MLSQIDHVRVMLQVVGHGVATAISALDKGVKLELCLMVGDMDVIYDPYSVPLLLDCFDTVKGVTGKLEVIEVGPVLDLDLEVLVAAPHDSG